MIESKHLNPLDNLDNIRVGYNRWSFIFYIGAVIGIVSAYLGVGTLLGFPITIWSFWYAGKKYKEAELKKEERA